MNRNVFLSIINSRLGLRFAPIGHSIPNIGVEEGGEKILKSIQLVGLNEDIPNFDITFKTPELLKSDSYLEDVLNLYSETTVLLLEKWSGGKTLVTLGGDHSISYISLAAVLEVYGEKNVGLVMFDSHADLHLPETSPSGNFHGMWLRPFFNGFSQYKLKNKKLKPNQLQFVGNLLLEDEEKRFLRDEDIIVHPSSEISESVISELVGWSKQFPHLHISFDIDVFTESLVSATGTPNPNGFIEKEIFPLLKELKKHPSISLDIVEFNPRKNGAEESLKLIEKIYETIL